MKSLKDRFDGEKELGKRLRECRLKAGLTQQSLATAVGRQGKGSHPAAGRLERGEVPNPGVGLLADLCARAGLTVRSAVRRRRTRAPVIVFGDSAFSVSRFRTPPPSPPDS